MARAPRTSKSTSTSSFGVGRRESHDSSGFYGRFSAPTQSDDDTVLVPSAMAEPLVAGDARHMGDVPDGSVALVVTSPPYFAGKQYEEELERDGVPASYLEYLDMLREVFAECRRVLEPGGRIAVNVANLGRKPYRSLSSDVIRILQDDLGLLLRGELIWRKGDGASGNCAWGSFRSASNPVVRDITERVVVASKGRFDRARTAKRRAAEGLPHTSTLTAEDFMSLTLDVWELAPESARRVGHPAPFPVELPAQLIRLYTYEGDLVLDPFLGSGSTVVAAAQLGRRYVGYDLDPAYVGIARRRLEAEGARQPDVVDVRGAARIAFDAVRDAGFTEVREDVRVARSGTVADLRAIDATGRTWSFLVAGPHTAVRGGMSRADVVWSTIGRATALRACEPEVPVVVLTTVVPRPRSETAAALRAVQGVQGAHVLVHAVVHDVIGLLDQEARARLGSHARAGT